MSEPNNLVKFNPGRLPVTGNYWQNIKEELSVSHSAAQLNSDELPNMHAILAMFVQCICVSDPDISFLN